MSEETEPEAPATAPPARRAAPQHRGWDFALIVLTVALLAALGVQSIAGTGYAWWVGRSLNLTLGLDLLAQGYGRSDTYARSATAAALMLGFDWY